MKENGGYMNCLTVLIKGVIIGFFMLVPGISGGSIAIVLNMYNEMLEKANNLFKSFKLNFTFLFIAALGGVLGLVVSSFFMDYIINTIYFELIYVFLGVMLLYIFDTLRKQNDIMVVGKLSLVMIGMVLGYLITIIPPSIINVDNYFMLFVLGVFLGVALVLPGISVSYVLLIFSLYDDVILAVKFLDYEFLIKLGLFVLVGIFVVIKLLYYFLSPYDFPALNLEY